MQIRGPRWQHISLLTTPKILNDENIYFQEYLKKKIFQKMKIRNQALENPILLLPAFLVPSANSKQIDYIIQMHRCVAKRYPL